MAANTHTNQAMPSKSKPADATKVRRKRATEKDVMKAIANLSTELTGAMHTFKADLCKDFGQIRNSIRELASESSPFRTEMRAHHAELSISITTFEDRVGA
ncbi:hypothetical protein UCDDS831_g02027 [Diplodia seriata]|uniref:Uncharacterized protein n=1 Tax=Diplodia seriata TaxID=420778 RepID=A0A0G2ETZ7_9PEZI|nr:hypothetical protein UCDDS831_g02027 [Diplodia seriata]